MSENSRTDASDVLIAFATSKWFWGSLILIAIILSGWASPERLSAGIADIARAWRCQS
jgi:hypothetical protein